MEETDSREKGNYVGEQEGEGGGRGCQTGNQKRLMGQKRRERKSNGGGLHLEECR
jgi:hypothetical protein